jgi:hypothetical protein
MIQKFRRSPDLFPWCGAAQLGFNEKILDLTPKSHIIAI